MNTKKPNRIEKPSKPNKPVKPQKPKVEGFKNEFTKAQEEFAKQMMMNEGLV